MIVRQGKSSPGRPDLIEYFCYVLLRTGHLTVLLYGSVATALYSINWVPWLSNLNIWRFIAFQDWGMNWAADHGTGDPWQNARTTVREVRSEVPRQYSGSPRNFCCFRFWIYGFAVLTDRGIVAIATISTLHSVLCTLYTALWDRRVELQSTLNL